MWLGVAVLSGGQAPTLSGVLGSPSWQSAALSPSPGQPVPVPVMPLALVSPGASATSSDGAASPEAVSSVPPAVDESGTPEATPTVTASQESATPEATPTVTATETVTATPAPMPTVTVTSTPNPVQVEGGQEVSLGAEQWGVLVTALALLVLFAAASVVQSFGGKS